MLLLQPHIFIHGSCNANSKKKIERRKKKKKKREEGQNEETEIQQFTQQESYVRARAAGIALKTRMNGPLALHNKKNDDVRTIERRRRNTLRSFRSADRTKGARQC
jgi:hypothetical protein